MKPLQKKTHFPLHITQYKAKAHLHIVPLVGRQIYNAKGAKETNAQMLLNRADKYLHFSYKMLTNKTICREPYDLPDGKIKNKPKPCGTWKKRPLGEELVKRSVFVLWLSSIQINLKQHSKMRHSAVVLRQFRKRILFQSE